MFVQQHVLPTEYLDLEVVTFSNLDGEIYVGFLSMNKMLLATGKTIDTLDLDYREQFSSSLTLKTSTKTEIY